jgi:phospholipase C
MFAKQLMSKSAHRLCIGLLSIALYQVGLGNMLYAQDNPRASSNQPAAVSPIQHVIVLLGENRSFDHVFGTYVPKDGQYVRNLLSEGTVDANGQPGPFFSTAHQFNAPGASAFPTSSSFTNSPASKTLYQHLPLPLAGGDQACNDTTSEPFCTLSVAGPSSIRRWRPVIPRAAVSNTLRN